MGLCMPSACLEEDIKIIMEKCSKPNDVKIKVKSVRSRQHYYYVWNDPTFIALSIVTGLLLTMTIVGTIYDLLLNHMKTNLFLKYTDCLIQKGSFFKQYGFIIKEMLLSFSVISNVKTIFNKSVGEDTLPVIHGLKCLSMVWVILGHTCIVTLKYSDNMNYGNILQKMFLFQSVLNGTFSVDSFFFTSGLLVSFLYFRTNAKGKLAKLSNGQTEFIAGTLHFIGLIVYRFARLTIPYLFTLGMVEILMKWFYYNSVFEPPTMDHINCPKYWWRNILYINTLYPAEEMCMLWSWYLSDDSQFYILGAFTLVLSKRHIKFACGVVLLLLTSSWFTTATISYANNYIPGQDDPLSLFDKIYDKPWTRLAPYFIGIAAGWYLFKVDCNIKMSKVTLYSGWTFCICCMSSLIYGFYDTLMTPFAGALYSAFSHTIWAFGLAWIVITCCTGHGGFINSILSSSVFYPYSRVTYCAYLVHPIVIRVMVMFMEAPLHLGVFLVSLIFLGQLVLSYSVSLLLSILVEAPIVAMLKIFEKIGKNECNLSIHSNNEIEDKSKYTIKR